MDQWREKREVNGSQENTIHPYKYTWVLPIYLWGRGTGETGKQRDHNDKRLEPSSLLWDLRLNSGTRLCWLMWLFSQRTRSWWVALWSLWACFWTWVRKTWAIFSSQSVTPTPVPRLCTNTGGLLRTIWWTPKRSTSRRRLLSTSASQMSRMELTSGEVFKHACSLPLTSAQQLGPLRKLWDRSSSSECGIWSGSMLTQGQVPQHEQNSFSVAEVAKIGHEWKPGFGFS